MSIFFKNEFLKTLQGGLMKTLVGKHSISASLKSEISRLVRFSVGRLQPAGD